MSYDRMLLILTFVVAIIGLVLGSVAISRGDSHEFIRLTKSSSSKLSDNSLKQMEELGEINKEDITKSNKITTLTDENLTVPESKLLTAALDICKTRHPLRKAAYRSCCNDVLRPYKVKVLTNRPTKIIANGKAYVFSKDTDLPN